MPPKNQINKFSTATPPYKLYNIGNNNQFLRRFIRAIETSSGKRAMKLLPMQPGDVPETYADIDDLVNNIGFKPQTTIESGISNFVEWFKTSQKYDIPAHEQQKK